MKPCGVLHGLDHGLWHIQPLHPLDLRMDAGDPHHVRRFSEAYRLSRLRRDALGLENAAKLQLPGPSFVMLYP